MIIEMFGEVLQIVVNLVVLHQLLEVKPEERTEKKPRNRRKRRKRRR